MTKQLVSILFLSTILSLNCYAHDPSCPATHVATPDELISLQHSSYPLSSFNAGTPDEDLMPLKNIIGDATVVGLGEGTHGTHEFFKMKHRLIEYLAKNMGFTIFSIEASMPEAYRLNDYVMNGNGNPKSLIEGMYFWTWDTQEVFDMVQWMREYNKTAEKKVMFTGFDMQFSNTASENVINDLSLAGFKSDAESLKGLSTEFNKWARMELEDREKYRTTTPYSEVLNKIIQLQQTIETEANTLKTRLGEKEYAWLKQNLVVIKQFYTMTTINDRDQAMAQNILWIHTNNPDAKMILWAHNGHVSKADSWMGSYLVKELKDKYRNIGLTTYEGQYTAMAMVNDHITLRRDLVLDTSPEGTLESNLKKLNTLITLVNFRHIMSENQPAFLLKPICWRSIGAMQIDDSFYDENISQDFDAIIDIQSTTASQPIA